MKLKKPERIGVSQLICGVPPAVALHERALRFNVLFLRFLLASDDVEITGVRKMPKAVTPNMPLKTAVPNEMRISSFPAAFRRACV
jgi:hypothetical protein